eukprot:Opistho-2@63702
MHLEQRCYFASILLNGIFAGAFTFASAVDARYLITLCDKKEADLLRRMFPIWWPFGKDLMVPLNLFCIFSNALVYYFTGESVWLLTSALCVFPLVWTVVAMAPTIVSLQSARDELPDDEDLYVAVRKFCRLHLVRLVAMLAAATITAHTVATKA